MRTQGGRPVSASLDTQEHWAIDQSEPARIHEESQRHRTVHQSEPARYTRTAGVSSRSVISEPPPGLSGKASPWRPGGRGSLLAITGGVIPVT